MQSEVDPAQIKLVVWDLDDTLWNGTLAEGPVRPIVPLLDLIRRLNDHGIVNSICSKNDATQAKRQLKKLRVLDEFIMPRIAWAPKGEQLKTLIADFQLRAPNILFIDDNASNLEEAKFYNPGIMTLLASPDGAPALQQLLVTAIGHAKPDGRERMRNYRLLEKKLAARGEVSNNEDFLRSSDIHICIERKWEGLVDRVDDLVNRANQLNYTKKPVAKSGLLRLLSPDYDSGVVKARDKFGDYGAIGFFAVEKKTGRLQQFVFSCRVLDMGIEHHVWAALGRPGFKLVKPVATQLNPVRQIDWIQEDKPEPDAEEKAATAMAGALGRKRVLMIGGCDLLQLTHYVAIDPNLAVATYFNTDLVHGIPVHRDGVSFLYGSRYYTEAEKDHVLKTVPFVAPLHFELPDLSNYNVIIYSPMVDYLQMRYVSVTHPKLSVSLGKFKNKKGDEAAALMKQNKIPASRISLFSREWIATGGLTGDQFQQALEGIFRGFHGLLVILGGVEKTVPEKFAHYRDHHRKLNEAGRQFASRRPHTYFLEMDDLIESDAEFTDAVSHYQRVVYQRMAVKIAKAITRLRKSRRAAGQKRASLDRGFGLF